MIEILIGVLIVPVIKYLIGHRIGRYIDKKIDEQPEQYKRYRAIWEHFQLRAKGQGHTPSSVVECHDCAFV